MTIKRALARLRYELVSLFLECGFAIAALAIAAVALPAILILAAQFARLASTGSWRGFAFSELIEVLRVDASALSDESRQFTAFILALPATLVLLVAALVLCLLAYGLRRLIRREHTRLARTQQHALIEDIERKLAIPEPATQKPDNTGA
jgi:hypothetical protein